MVGRKVIPKIEDFKKVNVENGTCAGAVAWVSDAINYFGKPIERGDEVIAADYTAFSPADSGAGWYKKPATLYAMSKNTAHPDEAALLLDYLLNNKEMALLQGVEKGIPISKSAKDYLDEAGKLRGLQYEASVVMDDNSKLREMPTSSVPSTKLQISCCTTRRRLRRQLSSSTTPAQSTLTWRGSPDGAASSSS